MRPSSPLDDSTTFVPYLAKSESFALGVELGEFLGPATHGIEVIEGEFRARLEAQLLVAAARLGYARKEWRRLQHGSYYGVFVSRACATGGADDECIASVLTQTARPRFRFRTGG